MQKNGMNGNKSFAVGNNAGVLKRLFFTVSAIIFIMLLSVFISVPAGTGNIASAASSKKTVVKKDDLSAEVTYGKEGKAKFSRNVPLTVDITNNGDDFSGIIRVRYRSSYGSENDVMVEQTFDIAAGQKKTIQMLILPLNIEINNLLIELCDDDGDVLDSKNMVKEMDISASGMFVGVLSDDASGLGYFKSIFANNSARNDEVFDEDETEEDYITNESQVATNEYAEDINNWEGTCFELKADDINDKADYLDMYDVLIIDNFDTNSLRPEQKKSIVSWVRNGGVLLLATGGNPDKVLGGFLDEEEYKVSVNGSAKTVKTMFGLSKEDIIQYSGKQGNTQPVQTLVSNLTLAGRDKVVLKDGNNELIQRKEIGLGALMVSEFSLSLPKNVWNTYGGAFMYILGKNMGKRYFMDMSSINNLNGYYYGANGIGNYSDALSRNETKSLPNLTLYTFILLAYAAIVGPIMYFVLLRMDKRTLLWGAVPAAAVVFSLLIYLLGSSTRIQKPYIKYLSEISLDKGDVDEVKMETQFTVTSPSNKGSEIDLKKDMFVAPNFVDEYISNIGGDITGYRYGVHKEGENQTIDLARVAAFSDLSFKAKQNVSVGGDIEINIKGKKGKLTGTVTNNTNHTLENCFVFYNNDLYYWNELPAGESVSADKADYYPNNNDPVVTDEDGDTYFDSDYVMEETTAGIYRAFGYIDNYEPVTDNRVARKMSIITQKIYSGFVSENQAGFFCGFLKEDDDREMFASAFDGVESYGVTAVTKLCD